MSEDAKVDVPESIVEETLLAISNKEDKEAVAQVFNKKDTIVLSDKLVREDGLVPSSDFYSLIQSLPMAAQIKLALYGNKAVRSILLREVNTHIPLLVLQNPKITLDEILEIAKNTMLDQTIYRAVSSNRSWMKSNSVQLALVSNPKVPIDISLRYVNNLRDKELIRLAKSKNIPQVVATNCKKVIERRRMK
jgi:hypothetical protein